MSVILKPKRGTEAAIVSAAGSSGLVAGEIYTATDTGRVYVALSSSTYREAALKSELSTGGTIPKGYISGLTLSNNFSDATNDIDIAEGEATDSTGAVVIAMPALLPAWYQKRLDANWAAGPGQGGRDSSLAIGNVTYHVHLVCKAGGADTDIYFTREAAEADALFKLQAETGGSGYIYARRIGSFMRRSGAIAAFRQFGDIFKQTGVVDRNSSSAVASSLLTLSVPIGIIVRPIATSFLQVSATAVSIYVSFGDGSAGVANETVANLNTEASGSNTLYTPISNIYTNTSSQVYFSQLNSSGTPGSSQVFTAGWIDTRGKDA